MFHRQAERYDRVVWIPEYGCFGEIVGAMTAYYSTISYDIGNGVVEELMESEDFQMLEELFEYEGD